MRIESPTRDTVSESESSADAGDRAQGAAVGRDREPGAPESPAEVKSAEFEQLKARLRHLVGTNNFRH
jgi:hypothetical protein